MSSASRCLNRNLWAPAPRRGRDVPLPETLGQRAPSPAGRVHRDSSRGAAAFDSPPRQRWAAYPTLPERRRRATYFKLAILVSVLALSSLAFAAAPLRVCADPNNLPFSNYQHQGFENKLALMLGNDLHRPIQFVWWPARVRFMEKWIKAGRCDVVMAVPRTYSLLLTTRPYYRSSYVFVTRRDTGLKLTSLTDDRLRSMKIGVHIIGDEAETVPPAHELADHGIVRNVVGYNIYGKDPLARNPSAELIHAVARSQVDVAIAWGPLAGYFAQRASVPLRVSPICSSAMPKLYPISFDISMGVRRDEVELLPQLNSFLARRGPEIHKLLRDYGVPLANGDGLVEGCH